MKRHHACAHARVLLCRPTCTLAPGSHERLDTPHRQVCAEAQHFFTRLDARCHACDTAWLNVLYLGIGVLTAVAAVGILWWVARRRDWLAHSSFCRGALHVYNALMHMRLQASAKLFVSFYRTQTPPGLLRPLAVEMAACAQHVPHISLASPVFVLLCHRGGRSSPKVRSDMCVRTISL